MGNVIRNVTEQEYAILAAFVYRKNSDERLDILPPGWSRGLALDEKFPDGLYISTFIKSVEGKPDELVISFRGTDFDLDSPSDFDNWFDAFGGFSEQIYYALKVTISILRDPLNAGKNVSFTGHSLGAGLASLMSVWFDRPATIFDAAPFQGQAFNINDYMTRYWRENICNDPPLSAQVRPLKHTP